jgi:hypothetical protein
MRMLAFSQPSRDQHRDPPVVTNCTHARCRNVRKPLPSDVRTVVSGVQLDATIGQASGHRMPGPIRPDTLSPPPGMPWRTGSDADRERTNGIRTSSIATTTKTARRAHTEPRLWRSVCSLATKVARRDGNTASDRHHGSDQAAA